MGWQTIKEEELLISQDIFSPVNCALHFTFAPPAVNTPQNGSLSPLCSSYMSCSLGRKQRKRKYKEEVISDQSHSFLRDLTYKQQTFLYDGLHTDLFPHVRANSRLAVLAATSASKDKHGRARWICLSCFSCTMRLLGAVQGICRVSKNSMSKEKPQFLRYTFLSMKDIYEGIVFIPLSPLHTVSAFLQTRHLLSLFFRTDFCLETSAILFSLVETVHAILKDQLKYNFQKISAS